MNARRNAPPLDRNRIAALCGASGDSTIVRFWRMNRHVLFVSVLRSLLHITTLREQRQYSSAPNAREGLLYFFPCFEMAIDSAWSHITYTTRKSKKAIHTPRSRTAVCRVFHSCYRVKAFVWVIRKHEKQDANSQLFFLWAVFSGNSPDFGQHHSSLRRVSISL